MKRNLILTPYLMCLLFIGTFCLITAEMQDVSAEALESGFGRVFRLRRFQGKDRP